MYFSYTVHQTRLTILRKEFKYKSEQSLYHPLLYCMLNSMLLNDLLKIGFFCNLLALFMFSITEERIDKLWHLRLNQYLIDHSIRYENMT